MDTQGKESSMGIQEKEDTTGAQEKEGTVGTQGEGCAIGGPGEGGAGWNETRGRIETMRGLCETIVDSLDRLSDYQRARGPLTLRDPFCRVMARAIWACAMAVETRARENLDAMRRADAERGGGGNGCPGDGER